MDLTNEPDNPEDLVPTNMSRQHFSEGGVQLLTQYFMSALQKEARVRLGPLGLSSRPISSMIQRDMFKGSVVGVAYGSQHRSQVYQALSKSLKALLNKHAPEHPILSPVAAPSVAAYPLRILDLVNLAQLDTVKSVGDNPRQLATQLVDPVLAFLQSLHNVACDNPPQKPRKLAVLPLFVSQVLRASFSKDRKTPTSMLDFRLGRMFLRGSFLRECVGADDRQLFQYQSLVTIFVFGGHYIAVQLVLDKSMAYWYTHREKYEGQIPTFTAHVYDSLPEFTTINYSVISGMVGRLAAEVYVSFVSAMGKEVASDAVDRVLEETTISSKVCRVQKAGSDDCGYWALHNVAHVLGLGPSSLEYTQSAHLRVVLAYGLLQCVKVILKCSC